MTEIERRKRQNALYQNQIHAPLTTLIESIINLFKLSENSYTELSME